MMTRYDSSDIRQRALVESNILKSVILETGRRRNGEFKPSLDDLLLHDYQISSSGTLNAILSNYIVDIAYVVDCINNPAYTGLADSYFKIVENLDENTSLPNTTKLLLDIDGDNGTFKTRELVLDIEKLDLPEGIEEFVNLDSVWYGLKNARNDDGDVMYSTLLVVDSMNRLYDNPGLFGGMNPFQDVPLFAANGDVELAESANAWFKEKGLKINSIVENAFFNNVAFEGMHVCNCKYILCCTPPSHEFSGLLGLGIHREGDKFAGLDLYDIGAESHNFISEMEFKTCSFHVIGEETTFLLAAMESTSSTKPKYRYFFLNESTFDPVYGFSEIDKVVVDGLTIEVGKAFDKVEQMRELDTVAIAMTDYGFWDIEVNATSDTTYSYSGRKEISQVNSFFKDESKLIRPDIGLDSAESALIDSCGSRFVEYDDIWAYTEFDDSSKSELLDSSEGELTGYWTSLNHLDGAKYWDYITGSTGERLNFQGGTQNFGVYAGDNDTYIDVLVSLDVNQFKNLLFANSTLVQLFIDWLYEQVVHTEEDHPFGEYYLYNNHDGNGFIGFLEDHLSPTFPNIQFQGMNKDLVNDRFQSMVRFIQGENPSGNTLQGYCGALYRFAQQASSTEDVEWLISGGASGLETALVGDFSGEHGQYESKYKNGYVTELVDGLVGEFHLLRYFRDYLVDHLKHDYSTGAWNALVLDGYSTSIDDSIQAIRIYMSGNVQTAMVLGGYNGTDYPGIDAHLHQNLITLAKSDVQNIMSLANAKAEMVASVQSAPFFREYATYDDLYMHKEDSTLFQVRYNPEFAALSRYLDSDTNAIGIDWNAARNELFGEWGDDANVLKNFIRTQFYRPMFFNPSDYKAFTNNPDAYYCITDKFYTNHDGDQHRLVFVSDDWGNVDKNASGLEDRPGVYEIPTNAIVYFKNTNTFEYQMQYEPIQIQNGRFVYEDVEYYVVYSKDNPNRVTSVYYNQFNRAVFHADGETPVDGENHKFTLNGSMYQIANDMVLWVDDNTFDTKYICDIRNNMFVLDGLWCILSDDGTKIEYAKVDDNELKVQYFTEDGQSHWTQFGLKFKFSNDASNTVSVIRRIQSAIVDKVAAEWCEYDDTEIDFDDHDKTWDWYIANFIVEFKRKYQELEGNVAALGKDVLYSGLLDTDCTIDAYHQVVDGDVVSMFHVNFVGQDGSQIVQELGTLIGNDAPVGTYDTGRRLVEVKGKTDVGNMSEDGLFESNLGGRTRAIFKNISDNTVKNSVNSVWLDDSIWQSNILYYHSVGQVESDDGASGDYTGSWNSSEYDGLPEVLQMTPISDISGRVYAYGVKVASDVPVMQCRIVKDIQGNEYLHFIAPNRDNRSIWRRYVVNFYDNTVDMFKFNPMPAHTVDFSTHYQPSGLRDGLVSNYRQYALNRVVQTMLVNRDEHPSAIRLAYGISLDMFPDQTSLDNYVLAGYPRPDEVAQSKFAQVFKNHVVEIDDTDMEYGFVYGKFASEMQEVFGENSTLTLVDGSSIKVKRVDSRDEFTYEVVFDIHLSQNKDLLESLYDGTSTSTYEKKYLLANMVVKDVKCEVKFTPRFKNEWPLDTDLVYDVSYTVVGGEYNVEWSKIVYAYNGQVQVLSLPETRTSTYNLSTTSSSESNKALSDIKGEIVLDMLGDLLKPKVNGWFKDINNNLTELSDEVIDYIVKLNTKELGDIWPLDMMEPSEPISSSDGKLIHKDYGNVILDGDIYDVAYTSDSTPQIKMRNGQDTYDLVERRCNQYGNSKYVLMFTGGQSGVNEPLYVNVPIMDPDNPTCVPTKAGVNEKSKFVTQQVAVDNIPNLDGGGKDPRYVVVDYPQPDAESQVEKWLAISTQIYKDNIWMKKYFALGGIETPFTTYKNVYLKFKPEYGPKPVDSKYISIPRWEKSERKPMGICSLKAYENRVNAEGNGKYEYVSDDGTFDYILLDEHIEDVVLEGDCGPGFDSESVFEKELIGDVTDNPSILGGTHSFVFDGQKFQQYAESDESDLVGDDWFGVPGQFAINFTTQGSGEDLTIKGSIVEDSPENIKCYELTDLPDARRGLMSSSVNVYDAYNRVDGGLQVPITVDYEVVNSSTGEANYPRTILRFKVPFRYKPCSLMVKPPYKYIDNNFLVDATTSTPSVDWVVNMVDADYGDIGDLQYGITKVPLDLVDGRNVAKRFNSISEYEFSKQIYIPFANGGLGDARCAPTTVRVLPPTSGVEKYGDILNRHYEVQTEVLAGIAHPNDWTGAKIWQDNTSNTKSVRAVENNHMWRQLIQNGDAVDREIPLLTRRKVEELVRNSEKLDRDYFEPVLLRLYDFLYKIQKEIQIGDMKSEVAKRCRIFYDATPTFSNHSNNKNDWNGESGLFGYNRGPHTIYENSILNFNQYLKNEFSSDYRKLVVNMDEKTYKERDYHNIVNEKGYLDYKDGKNPVVELRDNTIHQLYDLLDVPRMSTTDLDLIDLIFAQEGPISSTTGKIEYDFTWANKVRYMNDIPTTLKCGLNSLFVADGACNLFAVTNGGTGFSIQWYSFPSDKETMDAMVQSKLGSNTGEYHYEPKLNTTGSFKIQPDGWTFRMLNRDFSTTSGIVDAFAIHCADGTWYVPLLGCGIRGPSHEGYGIRDIAYEHNSNRIFVLFTDSNDIYAYDDIQEKVNFDNVVVLMKENSDQCIRTFNSIAISPTPLDNDKVFLDHSEPSDWSISIYGKREEPEFFNVEKWLDSSGGSMSFSQYNTILFGDSLFDAAQLRFHNISKTKDMYDILDVNEVDRNYYGLFKDDTKEDEVYTVFKCPSEENGVVQRLPWSVVHPQMYTTADSLYSLYVVQRKDDGRLVLRELSVPDASIYPEREIDIQKLYEDNNQLDGIGELKITGMITQDFITKVQNSGFFVLSNAGFHRIGYRNAYQQLSIDSLVEFKSRLHDAFETTVLKRHLDEMHHKEQSSYFDILARKVNQYAEGFETFSLIPTEFPETQDVGVIPGSKIDDTDDIEDHRTVTVLASTDILQTGGMVAQSDSNPGIVTCAVSNPATIYDDQTVFIKSQRNPSIEGSEFYDFIYDQDGNVLMDLYAIPFIYRINTNNTYDLYINVPTTRTKYINRLAGTLRENGTSLVQNDDTRTRLNFQDEALPNNLDESTTKLRVYIDKKYISVGTVELVEICGNSIPTQIYRDTPNNGLYDSIALESRWNGEVVQIDEPSRDINKVMLEFECYGTDSQSIHIQGKTLINRAMEIPVDKVDEEETEPEPAREYAVKFVANGGSFPGTDKEVITRIYREGQLLGDLPIATRKDKTNLADETELAGWFTSMEDGQGKQAFYNTPVTENTTYYAHWNMYIHYIAHGEPRQMMDGSWSSFSQDNYLETVQEINFNNPFEIVVPATTGNDISGGEQEILAASAWQRSLEAGTCASHFSWEFEDLHWDLHGDQLIPETNTKYMTRIVNDGTTTKFYVKKPEDQIWVLDLTETNTGKLPTHTLGFGTDLDSKGQYWKGSIDVGEAYLKMGGNKYKFKLRPFN